MYLYRSIFLQFQRQLLTVNNNQDSCHRSPLGGRSGSLWPDLNDGPSRVWLGTIKLVVKTQLSVARYNSARPKELKNIAHSKEAAQHAAFCMVACRSTEAWFYYK